MAQEMGRISNVRRTLGIAMTLAGLVGWGLGIDAAGPAESLGQAITTTSSATVTPGQFNARIHREGDESLPYQLLVPKDYASAQPLAQDRAWPLIVWLHGSGENGTDNRAQLQSIAKTFLADGDRTRAFVLVPQCPPKLAWHAVGLGQTPPVTGPSRMLIATIAELQQEFHLDDRRIYVGGFSMGGCGTWELISRFPGVFAASFAISGGPGDRPALAPLIKDIPIWAFHGDNDNTGTPEDTRQIVKALKALGGPVKYTEYLGGKHECVTALAEPELPVWLLAQRRGAPANFAEVKVPPGATMILKTLAQGTHDTWTGPVQHTAHGVPRIAINELRYRLRPAPNADPSVAAILEKIGKGEITGTCQVTGTVELEDLAWLAVERIEVKK